MLIDCESCAARPRACADCMVTVLLGPPGREYELDDTERQALDALADGGLIPPLRLVPIVPVEALGSRLRAMEAGDRGAPSPTDQARGEADGDGRRVAG